MNPEVSSYEIDEAPDTESLVGHPLSSFQIFIVNQLEKCNVAGCSGSEYFIENQVHLAQVEICDLVQLILFGVVCLHYECLALSVEREDLVCLVIVEALVREVLHG